MCRVLCGAAQNFLFRRIALTVALMVIKSAVSIFLMAIQLAMLLRAVLSWFPLENRFIDFLHCVTEPFIYPIRCLFERLGWFTGMPIDISFMVSYLLISVVMIFLS